MSEQENKTYEVRISCLKCGNDLGIGITNKPYDKCFAEMMPDVFWRVIRNCRFTWQLTKNNKGDGECLAIHNVIDGD